MNEIHVTATGGSGGLATDFAGEDETFAAGGDGGVVSADLAVTPGQVLTVDVGQQGRDSGVSDPYVGGLGGEASGSSGIPAERVATESGTRRRRAPVAGPVPPSTTKTVPSSWPPVVAVAAGGPAARAAPGSMAGPAAKATRCRTPTAPATAARAPA